MILHTVMVTFNRRECSEKSLRTYLQEVTVPFTITIVDNGSTDGTQEWVNRWIHHYPMITFLSLGENKYPGYATNRGWELAPKHATHLHRADNDWTFLPGWCDHVKKAFRDPAVGQVGLRTQREEPVSYNVGGNNVIRRELWDQGLRYDERPWTELPAGHSEDTYLSPAVEAMGYQWTRVRRPCIIGNSVESTEDPYYQASYRARRIYGFR